MSNQVTSEIKFIIVIATYYRKDGLTLKYLTRCLESVKKQTYTNWVVYLIGDEYENTDEFNKFATLIDTNKIIIHNKPDPERKHILDKSRLWNIAGASAMNYGLNLARSNGEKYYVHLDDDDFWESKHLENLYQAYQNYSNCIFAYTKSTYPYAHVVPNKILPREDIKSIFPNNLLPRNSNLIHSSVSFRCDIIPFDYHTTHNISEIRGPSDAIMWDTIRQFILSNPAYCCIFIPEVTCRHDEEGSIKN